GLARIDRRRDPLDAGGVGEDVLPDARESRITEVQVPVPEGSLFYFSEVVRRAGVASLQLREAHETGEESHLGEHGTAGGGRQRDDLGPSEWKEQRAPDLRGVDREVSAGNEAADSLLTRLDLARDLSTIKTVGAAVADRLESARERGLAKESAGNGRFAVGEKDRGGLGVRGQPLAVLRDRDRTRDRFGHHEALPREAHRGRQDRFPREPPRGAVGAPQAVHGAGDAGRERSFG